MNNLERSRLRQSEDAPFDTQDGCMILQLGITITMRFEPDPLRAMAAVADKSDMFLLPCVRVKSKVGF